MAEEEPWLGLAEAAARTGLAREAIRSRARRGLVNSRKGNDGRLLVQILAGLAEADRADDRAMTDLLRIELARSIAAADTATAVAEARVEARA